jgi:Uma2 family endonuclease
MDRAQFFEFCQLNNDMRIERTSQGDLNIMPPTGGESGRQSGEAFYQLAAWSKRDGTGISFDSSTGFWLPNGAERSPDAAWVRRERWEELTAAEREEFPPLAPDFVIEVRSRSERLRDLQAKLQEYVENGVRLAWLIDPFERRVEIYRPNVVPLDVDNPATLNGEPELAGFIFDLRSVWGQ